MTSVDRDTRTTQTSAAPSLLAKVWAAYPVHPPLTHFAIGAYTTASVLAVIGAAGASEPNMAKGWWLSLLVGLIGSIPTAASGLVEFLALRRDHPARPAVIIHLVLALLTYPWFIAAILLGHAGYLRGSVSTGPLALTLTGFAILTAAGVAGGRLVFSYGIRVKRQADQGR
jgi:uncharacterized membrane protein